MKMNNRYISMVLNEDSINTTGYVLNESYESKPMNIKYNEKCDTTIFQTILQEADAPNRNGRIYTKKAIQEALDRPFIVEKLKRKTWYGENGRGCPSLQ